MFAPIVTTASRLIGKKEFNQLRGKVISAHCKTITKFCNAFGISSKERQKLIKLAKSNGKTLGLLA